MVSWLPPVAIAAKRTCKGNELAQSHNRGRNNMRKYLVTFLRDEEGLTMVEYAVAGTLITLAAVAAFTALGGAVQTKITAIVTALNGGGGGGGGY
jgi:pilus assembly protein Flp/PilA